MDLMISEHPKSLQVRKKDGEIVDSYSYDLIYAYDTEDRERFFRSFSERINAESFSLYCTCNPKKPVPMTMVSSVHIRSYPGKKKDHIEGCNFEGNLPSNYYENWREDADGEIRVRFDNTNFSITQKSQKKRQMRKRKLHLENVR